MFGNESDDTFEEKLVKAGILEVEGAPKDGHHSWHTHVLEGNLKDLQNRRSGQKPLDPL